MKENKNRNLAERILKEIGGESNVSNSTHCATRLRLVLNDESEEMVSRVKNITGVIDVVRKGGQFQIVIGNSVDKVYNEFSDLAGTTEGHSTNNGNQNKEKENIFNRIIATMSAVFAPFVYILAAAGMLQGSLIILSSIWPTIVDSGTYMIFDVMSWAPFTFLPIFIAITASKHFKSNTYIAVFANAALVAPGFSALAERAGSGEVINFIGMPLSETVYTSTVIPAILLVWLLSYLERWIEKILPEVVTRLFTPLLAVIIAVPLTIMVIGPISTVGANSVAAGYTWLSQTFPAVAGVLVGGLWQFFVLLGVHWGITPVILANHAQYGMDSFQAYQTIAVVAQVGAALAVFIKTKKQEVRSVSLSATITGVFGITEPAIYGVNLRFKKPFYFGIISGAVGAFVASFFNVYSFVYTGLPSMITIMNNYNVDYPSSFWGVLIGIIIALVLPIILVQIFGYGDDNVEQSNAPETTTKNGKTSKRNQVATVDTDSATAKVYPPINGTLVQLSDVPDPVFSSGAMGKGIAIEPLDQKVYAPFDGEVTMIAKTKHAIGLTSVDGVELLIHIGLETVELEGKPYTVHVEEGQKVSHGELLMEFDINAIEQSGRSAVTPIIVTNSDAFTEISIAQTTEAEDTIITIKK